MNDTNQTSAEQAIQDQLRRLKWMIPAMRRMDEAAQCMLRRAQGAVKDTEALLADQPCSMSWVDFAEGDLRAAREAKAELAKLLEQQKMLEFFLRKD
jgi:hypothetical protein